MQSNEEVVTFKSTPTVGEGGLITVASYLVFPVIMGGGMLLVSRGIAADINPYVALMMTMPFALLLILALERVMPYREDWNEPDGQFLNDAGHFLIGNRVGGWLSDLLLGLSWYALADWIFDGRNSAIWPTSLPLWIQVGVAMVLAEFGAYWQHRVLHEWKPYWRCHALHHSAERLYVVKAGRQNPFDFGLFGVFSYGPLILAGAPPEVFFWYVCWLNFEGMLIHSNVSQRFPQLAIWIFNLPPNHRVHHTIDPSVGSGNFGTVLMIFDHLFGTFRDPKFHTPAQVGIHSPFPDGFWQQLAVPVYWNRDEA